MHIPSLRRYIVYYPVGGGRVMIQTVLHPINIHHSGNIQCGKQLFEGDRSYTITALADIVGIWCGSIHGDRFYIITVLAGIVGTWCGSINFILTEYLGLSEVSCSVPEEQKQCYQRSRNNPAPRLQVPV